jgi:hypothetical protein
MSKWQGVKGGAWECSLGQPRADTKKARGAAQRIDCSDK